MRANGNEVMAGALAFIRAGNPQGTGFVVNFSNEAIFGLPEDLPFSSNLRQMEVALSAAPISGATAMYDALAAALQHLQLGQSDKKVLLLISDGGDNASEHHFAQVFRMAQSANTIIYTIGLFDQDSAGNNAGNNPKVLKKLASETGGEAYFPGSAAEVVSLCEDIARDIRHQYDLAYKPPENGEDTTEFTST
jgi:Ca-activated chloride channel homolog